MKIEYKKKLKNYEKYILLIIDEIGYLPIKKEEENYVCDI